jgi:hypothetical protein
MRRDCLPEDEMFSRRLAMGRQSCSDNQTVPLSSITDFGHAVHSVNTILAQRNYQIAQLPWRWN